MTFPVRRWRDLPAEPWRNGKGVTRTLAARANAWRISVADIVQDGPYSRFADTVRLSIVLDGDGVVLTAQDTVVRLQWMQAVMFDGGTQWQAALIGRPVSVLNVIAGSQGRLPRLDVIERDITWAEPGVSVVVALDTECAIARNGATHVLKPGEFAVLDEDEAHAAVSISPGAVAGQHTPSSARPPIVVRA